MMVLLTAILALADLATTILGVRMAGASAESNGMLFRFISRFGVEAFAVVFLIGAALVIAAAAQFEGALAGLAAALSIVLANNLLALWRLSRSQI